MMDLPIQLAEAFAVLVVAPCALVVLRRRRGLQVLMIPLLATLGFAALGILLPVGTIAGTLVVPWLLFAASTAIRRGPAEFRRRSGSAFLTCAALAFWVVAAGWLVCARAGIAPLGFAPTIVALTAVHFHVAGLGGLTLAAVVTGATPRRRAAVTFGLLAAVGIALVAVGITGPQTGMPGLVALQAIGGAVAGVGFIGVAVLQIGTPGSRSLHLAALLCVALGMALALWFSLGAWLAVPAPSLPVMLRTHGILNGVGFVLCSLAAWLGVPSSDADRLSG